MRAILIEDEEYQQELMQIMFSKYFSEIDCVGVAGDIDSGLSLIRSEEPDLLFLDVMLSSGTCFDLLSQLDSIDFDIIFTTSHSEFALKAFRLAAVDYLLKPVLPHDLRAAITKLKAQRMYKKHLDRIEVLLTNVQHHKTPHYQPKIALPTLTGFKLVSVEEIVRCESDNTYTTFFLKDSKPVLVSKTLKSCEQMLSDFSFFRVHNSSLINLKFVREYIKGEGGTIIMEDGSEVHVSRRRKDDFLSQFSQVRL